MTKKELEARLNAMEQAIREMELQYVKQANKHLDDEDNGYRLKFKGAALAMQKLMDEFDIEQIEG